MFMLDILPEPHEVRRLPGPSYQLGPGFSVTSSDPLLVDAATALLVETFGNPGQDGGVVLRLDSSVDNAEKPGAYVLQVVERGVEIIAAAREGIFHGLATLVQFGESYREIPAVRVADFATYPWRGMHLDCARHFLPVDDLRRFIDYLWRYKFNRLHWHLTDDQGWRAEIKAFPRLTAIGGWRKRTIKGHAKHEPWPFEYDEVPHGGFYTQQEMSEIVHYADARGIEIIPEIEMPGHATAAIAAYPELGCPGYSVEVAQEWGIYRHLFNVGSDRTMEMLRTVLDEVIEIFPSKWIHLGGDECPTTFWERDPQCMRRMQVEGFKNHSQLHGWFMSRMGDHVVARGRTPMAWDDVLDSGIDLSPFVITAWRGESHLRKALQLGHQVVNCDMTHVYFDHYQVVDTTREPLMFGGFTDLERVLSFDPAPSALSRGQGGDVIGAQGHLWREYLPTNERIEYNAFPRAIALAEVLWRGGPRPKMMMEKIRRESAFLIRRGVNCCLLE